MEEELNYSERKEYAKLMYTRHDVAIADVALSVGAEETEVNNWIDEGAWDKQKRSLLTLKTAQLHHLYSALEQLNDKMKTGEQVNVKDVDLFVKYTAAIKNLEKLLPTSNILEVSAHFTVWLRRRDAELAKRVIVEMDAFIKYRSSVIGT